MQPQIVASEEVATQVSCDVLVVGATSERDGPSLSGPGEDADRALDGYLSEHLQASGFRGDVGEIEIVTTVRRLPAKAVAVVGAGPRSGLSAATLRRAAGGAARTLARHPVVASALHLTCEVEDAAAATVEGFLLGSYRFTEYKSDPKASKLERVLVLGGVTNQALERAEAVVQATVLARDLTNEPPSTITPDALARRAREVADVSGLACDVADGDALQRRGFGGLLTVARGSAQPPRLIELRYSPADATGKVVIVGKGITFDSGGLSIKDAKSMETMKTDMAGAAAVIGTMGALGRIGASVEVVGIVPTCENMPGGNAVRPGDVIEHYGGRTTEVNNTDAEGRLVLGDALAYASEMEPDALVDLATLTGGVMVALGRKATGLFSNNDSLAGEIEGAARCAGERMWRLPLYGDYRSELESEVADSKNSGSRYGSSIIGALFLEEFVGRGIPWAHLDIAGSARAESDSDENVKGGTGVGVRTMLSWIESRGR